MPFSSSDAASWRLEKPGRRDAATARVSTTSATLARCNSARKASAFACSYPIVKSEAAIRINLCHDRLHASRPGLCQCRWPPRQLAFQHRDVLKQTLAGELQEIESELRVLIVELLHLIVGDAQHVAALD